MADDDLFEIGGEGSEFGAGLVVCLVKFSEHLWNRQAETIQCALRWLKMSEAKRDAKRAEVDQFPRGDAARSYGILLTFLETQSPENVLSMVMEIWANGASDHFYDLDPTAPDCLKELASLTLEMGRLNDFVWGEEHWKKIRELWKESALVLDDWLGVDADWGKW